MSELSQHAIECIAEVEAERDELAGLLKRVHHRVSPVVGSLRMVGDARGDQLNSLLKEIRDALANLDQASDEPCERCGGEKTVAITPEQFEQGGNGWERPCPDCTEAERHA